MNIRQCRGNSRDLTIPSFLRINGHAMPTDREPSLRSRICSTHLRRCVWKLSIITEASSAALISTAAAGDAYAGIVLRAAIHARRTDTHALSCLLCDNVLWRDALPAGISIMTAYGDGARTVVGQGFCSACVADYSDAELGQAVGAQAARLADARFARYPRTGSAWARVLDMQRGIMTLERLRRNWRRCAECQSGNIEIAAASDRPCGDAERHEAITTAALMRPSRGNNVG
jgi:hypothetical protein